MSIYGGIFRCLLYLELISAITLGIHLPIKPDPIFLKPDVNNIWLEKAPEHPTKGQWDYDWFTNTWFTISI